MTTRYQLAAVATTTAFLLLGLAATTTTAAKPRVCEFSAIFNFGDSNSDTGGLSAIYGYTLPPPYGETFFHHPAGRASDGRLIIDFIAERLGFQFLSGYLDSVGSNYTSGVNFATGGSTILPSNTTMRQGGGSPVSLDIQDSQFSQFKNRSQVVRNRGGVFKRLLPADKAFSRGLYTFDIGQNDLSNGYKMNKTTEEVKSSVADLLSAFSKVIKDVYAKGGRAFWIHNTGPLGCLPFTLFSFPATASPLDENGCSIPINDAAQFFNLKLKEKVEELRVLLPKAAITYVDMYSVKYSLISNAKKLGFQDPLLVCCGHGATSCGKNENVNGTIIIKLCAHPQSTISWDGVHYSDAANKWIFDKIVNGSFSDPAIPLNLACNRNRH